MNLGPTIKRIRKDVLRLKLREVAEASGLNIGTIWAIENIQTTCSLTSASMIAGALGMRTSELVRLAEENL